MDTNKYLIGYTSGVFDLFHIGHLNILRSAKLQCDFLIVAVSVDDLVAEYKGSKPVIPYAERYDIVESCRFVDKVVPQYTLDKFDAWKKWKYNVLFHGSDWKNSQLFSESEKLLSQVGVDVVFFPYTNSTSSTILTNALKKLCINTDEEL